MSFGDAEYAGKRKRTRREEFLAEMEKVVPWSALESLIEPHYPKAGGGRRPYPLAAMLRTHLMQNWFGLSDPAMEEALYEITPLRHFARLRCCCSPKTDHLCSLKIDQGWTPRERPSAGV